MGLKLPHLGKQEGEWVEPSLSAMWQTNRNHLFLQDISYFRQQKIDFLLRGEICFSDTPEGMWDTAELEQVAQFKRTVHSLRQQSNTVPIPIKNWVKGCSWKEAPKNVNYTPMAHSTFSPCINGRLEMMKKGPSWRGGPWTIHCQKCLTGHRSMNAHTIGDLSLHRVKKKISRGRGGQCNRGLLHSNLCSVLSLWQSVFFFSLSLYF